MIRCRYLVAVLLATLALSSAAEALDGERKGFILEIGLGPGFQNSTQEFGLVGALSKADNSILSGAVDFKIGYGVNNKLLVTWTSNGTFGSGDDVLGDSVTLTHTTGGLGVTYFLNETAPSPFFDATIGVSGFDDGDLSGSGFGLGVGGGYEVRDHWTASVDVLWGNPTDDANLFGETLSYDVTALSVGATVSWLWY